MTTQIGSCRVWLMKNFNAVPEDWHWSRHGIPSRDELRIGLRLEQNSTTLFQRRLTRARPADAVH